MAVVTRPISIILIMMKRERPWTRMIKNLKVMKLLSKSIPTLGIKKDLHSCSWRFNSETFA